jgi:hypothetical protein
MKRKLSLEPLEVKETPSGGGVSVPPGVYLNAYGTLGVYGDAKHQLVRVWHGDDNLIHASLGHIEYVPDGSGGFIGSPMVDVEKTYDPVTVNRIAFFGRDGNDTLYFTDTNGEAKEVSFTDFQKLWSFAGDGLAYAGMEALGIKKQTMPW